MMPFSRQIFRCGLTFARPHLKPNLACGGKCLAFTSGDFFSIFSLIGSFKKAFGKFLDTMQLNPYQH